MARTGLIRAGLASAGAINPQAMQKDLSEAEKRAQAVQDRVERFAAGDTSSETTDGLKSLVGGLGAASIFGGPAGLLIYGVSQAMSKKRREGVAAYRAHAAENAQDIAERTDAAVANLVGMAETGEQKAQAKFFQAEYDTIRAGLDSADPAVVSQTAINLQEFVGTLDDEYDQWLTRQVADEKEQRRQDEWYAGRATTIRQEQQRESGRYIATAESFQRMTELMKQGTNISDTALVFALADVIMPGEIKTEDDINKLQGSGLVSQQLTAKFSEVLGGNGSIDPTVREEMLDVARASLRIQIQDQNKRNSRAIERARDDSLPERYYNNVIVPVDGKLREAAVPVVVPARTTDGRDMFTEENLATKIGEALSWKPSNRADMAAVAARGNQIQTDLDTGEQFEVDQDGNIVADFAKAGRWENRDGDTLVRITDKFGNESILNASEYQRAEQEARMAPILKKAEERGGSLRPINE